MLDNNVIRMTMFIGAIIVVGILIHLLMNNYDEIKNLINNYFSYKLQKY